jgi:hypothetical protein
MIMHPLFCKVHGTNKFDELMGLINNFNAWFQKVIMVHMVDVFQGSVLILAILSNYLLHIIMMWPNYNEKKLILLCVTTIWEHIHLSMVLAMVVVEMLRFWCCVWLMAFVELLVPCYFSSCCNNLIVYILSLGFSLYYGIAETGCTW